MRDGFGDYHPLIGMSYFVFMLGVSMFVTHPLCQLLSLCGAVSYLSCLRGLKFMVRYGVMLLPAIAITALINPAFNHRGMTILTYLPNGNPLTLECMLYGVSAAVMLVNTLLWFACFSQVMTADKLMMLLGRLIPALSLLLTMALRMVPRLVKQLQKMILVQKGLGRDIKQGSIWQRGRLCARLFSAWVTWALENAVETADAMKSRGYGLGGRTAFAPFRWQKRDQLGWRWLIGSAFMVIYSAKQGRFYFKFYPVLAGGVLDATLVLGLAGLALLAFWPLFFNLWEAYKWKHLQSSISPSPILEKRRPR